MTSLKPFIPRKNLFTVHSGVTALMMELIIKYYNLDPKNVYVLSRGSCLQDVLDLNLIPRHNILNSDHIYEFIAHRYQNPESMSYFQFYEDNYSANRYELNTVLTLLDDNVSSDLKIATDCKLDRDYFSKVDFEKIRLNKASKYYEPYDQPKADDPNLDFNLFTQHCSDPFFNTLVQSKHCRSVKYCEEGTMNYLDYDEYQFDNEVKNFRFVEDNYPQYNYEYLGILRNQFNTLYRFDEVGNPNLDLERSGFIGLSDITFKESHIDHIWLNKKINLDIVSVAAPHRIAKQDNHYYRQQQHIYKTSPKVSKNLLIQTALKDPSFMGNFVNVIVCENFMFNKITQEDYLKAHKELIKRVINSGIFYFYIKFHSLCSSEIKQLLLHFLDNEVNCLYTILDDQVCLEREFAYAQANTFIVHTIYNSLGLYASKFSQLTFTYSDLYAHIPFYQRLRSVHNFDLQRLINHFNTENQTNLDSL